MHYQIFSVATSEHLVIRDADDPANALYLTDLRDLLRLRTRINTYVDSLQADGQIEQAPPQPGEMISAIQARAEAAEQGQPVGKDTLRMAMQRGNIPGAHKRGGRWYLPRREFEEWLQGHLSRK